MALPGGGKQPMHIAMADGRPFALAGLTERWLGPDGEPLDTCTIVTTGANALLGARPDAGDRGEQRLRAGSTRASTIRRISSRRHPPIA